ARRVPPRAAHHAPAVRVRPCARTTPCSARVHGRRGHVGLHRRDLLLRRVRVLPDLLHPVHAARGGRLAAHRSAEADEDHAVEDGRRSLGGRVEGGGRRFGGGQMTARMSVVIPAHDEEAVIGRLLDGLVGDAHSDELEIVVVANGCTDATVEVARSYGGPVSVVEVEQASKIAALEAGDQEAVTFPRAYVDADVVIDVPTLLALADALDRPSGPLVASPRLDVDAASASWPVRAHYRI